MSATTVKNQEAAYRSCEKKTRSLGSRLIFQEPSCHNLFAAQKSYEDTAAEGVDLFESELGGTRPDGTRPFLERPPPLEILHVSPVVDYTVLEHFIVSREDKRTH